MNEKLSGKQILVTGGAGFIGSNIVEKLLEYDVKKVIVLDNLFSGFEKNISRYFNDNRFQFVNGDIRDFELVCSLVKDIDIICHQAAWGSVPRSLVQPKDYHENNVTGFFNIIEAARINGVKRVIYASSSSVYGDEMTLPKREEKIGKPLAPYGATKYIDEVYADIYWKCYGLEIIGLRYFNVFGPRQNPEGAYAAVIPKFINLMLEGKPVIINGDGNYSRDFTFIENVVDFNLRCFVSENPAAFGKVYNVACGNQYSLNDLVNVLKKEIDMNAEVVYGKNRDGDIPHSLADISLSGRLLGYEPLVRFEEGIKKTVDFFRKIK